MDLIDRYLSLGWSLIPLEPRSKKPAISWREYQTRRPDQEWAELWRLAFPVPKHGLAVVCGEISGIIVVDCDDTETAARFRAAVPFLTPEVITRRGSIFTFVTEPVSQPRLSSFPNLAA